MDKTKPKIGFDLDGVLADFSGRFVELADILYGFDLDPSQQTGWDYEYKGVPLNKRYVDEIWKFIHSTDNFWMSLSPIEESRVLVDYAQDINPVFITSRAPTQGMSLEDQGVNWIRRHFYIPNPQVICNDKKGPIVAALGLKAFIDDKPENCIEIANAAPNCQVFMMVAPYNKNFFSPSITRVSNLNQFFARIEGGLFGSEERAA